MSSLAHPLLHACESKGNVESCLGAWTARSECLLRHSYFLVHWSCSVLSRSLTPCLTPQRLHGHNALHLMKESISITASDKCHMLVEQLGFMVSGRNVDFNPMDTRGKLNTRKALEIGIVRNRREADTTIKVQARALTQPGIPDSDMCQASRWQCTLVQAISSQGDLRQGS